MSRYIIIFLFSVVQLLDISLKADDVHFSPPFDFPTLFSGNFAELRSNHFHGGVDFKTQGVTGKPIHAPADGYVSRVTVAPGGYGNAMYVTHYNGYTTVYGHLEKFMPAIERLVRERQYRDETFSVDISFGHDEYPVKRGEVISLSGNTGYSFGPHLHFEVRSQEGNRLINPLIFYKEQVRDTKPPKAYAVALYPRSGKGSVAGSNKRAIRKINGNTISDTLRAWGEVGFGVKALDFMDNTSNNYGVYRIELTVDDSLLYSSTMDSVSFSENRLINAWVDYEAYYMRGEWIMRSHLIDNNPLKLLSVDENRGWLRVDEERLYHVEYTLADYHGNVSRYHFFVKGEHCDAQPVNSGAAQYFCWDTDNELRDLGMRLKIPKGELFEDAALHVVRTEQPDALSDRYNLNGITHPLWHGCELSIRLKKCPSDDAKKYYIKYNRSNGGYGVGGVLKDGWITADISSLGCYEAAIDTVPPIVRPVNEKQWGRNGLLSFYMSDSGTGIKSYKGYIDGNFKLFKFSSKNVRLTCNLRAEGISRGTHHLRLLVTDNAGNETIIEKTFKY
ncbi:MAG: M23 family metallopeptidase [Bacteroidaceae bacterium]|nr:M23 family metallopeptidase [Bacteroidaceae bacterium]